MFDAMAKGGEGGKMTRMEIAAAGAAGEKDKYSSAVWWRSLSRRDVVAAGTALVVIICIVAYVISLFTASPPPSSFVPSVLGSDLRYLLHKTFMKASKEGSLVKSNTSFPPEIVIDQEIEFLVMTLRDANFKSRTVSSPVDPFDFHELDPNHIVSPIAPMHTLILNKFYTINEHSIVITNHFERQETLLSYQDIDAWFFCVTSVKAVGFYNSDAIAGASQPHKHMQLIPLNEIRNLSPSSTYTLPIDISIRSRIISKGRNYFLPFSTTNGRMNGIYGTEYDTDGVAFLNDLDGASQENVYRIPEYKFKHAVVALIGFDDWSDVSEKISYSEYLTASYRQLLWELKLISSLKSRASVASGPYNLLLTDRWMLMICRQQESYISKAESPKNTRSNDRKSFISTMSEEDFEVASINGLGFAGFLLARSPRALQVIKERSPLAVLQGVSESDP